jgi:hypothetical protein
MKLSQEQTVSIDAPLIKKAQEMVNGLILEYGIFMILC